MAQAALPPTEPPTAGADSPAAHAGHTGLLLTGGGARAAYQVGVLEAIADLRLACGAGEAPNPFPIITGTSAGAINAAALACGADQFKRERRACGRRGFGCGGGCGGVHAETRRKARAPQGRATAQ